MPINTSHIGREYRLETPYRVSAAKIAEFARALADTNPAYFSSTPIAPPTFAAVIVAQAWQPVFDDPELGIQLDGTIHADQRFELARPLAEGDDVLATSVIEKVRVRGSTAMITICVKLATVTGEDLGTARSQMICTLNKEAK